MTEGSRPKAASDSGAPGAPSVPAADLGEGPVPWMFEPGRVVGARYRVDGVLGRGGMGVVTAGTQLDLQRPVAIKFLRPNLAQNARPTRRFAREARAIAKMRSEHAVRVFDVGEEEGVPFIVMERLNGNDLAAELERGPLSVAVTIEYVLQACEAIAEAHSLGIVHRDLKPSNLFLAEGFAGRRTIKILDFGVSKWLGLAPDLNTTSEGSFIGTPAYASPEQLTRPESVDQRTDVWALGVVLYQCLSARLPFQADSVPRLCVQVLSATPSPLLSSSPLPAGLESVILHCLHKDVDQRCADVLELARALRPFAPDSARHLIESIESLSNGASAGVRRSSDSGSAPQTTLTFSHEADRADARDASRSPTKGQRDRLRVVLLSMAAFLLLVWGLLARPTSTAKPASEPERPPALNSRSGLPDAPPPSNATAPPIPLTAVTPSASTGREPATPRAVAKPRARSTSISNPSKRAEPTPSAARQAEAGPLAEPSAEGKSPQPGASAAKASNPDMLDPAQLYRR